MGSSVESLYDIVIFSSKEERERESFGRVVAAKVAAESHIVLYRRIPRGQHARKDDDKIHKTHIETPLEIPSKI